jgi:hypothetical protein
MKYFFYVEKISNILILFWFKPLVSLAAHFGGPWSEKYG